MTQGPNRLFDEFAKLIVTQQAYTAKTVIVPMDHGTTMGPIQGLVDMRTTIDKITEGGANATMTVDLEKQEITDPDGETIPFEVEAFRKHCLLNGLDDIGLTLKREAAISAFEAKSGAARPWL